ncbi:hypothetical protein M422DRAFT_243928 [Sphaerobolus stellatus SS14]|nr:hypothetical protein M422DRAFT_243928 [Sphaerobolus stellatus SS14]
MSNVPSSNANPPTPTAPVNARPSIPADIYKKSIDKLVKLVNEPFYLPLWPIKSGIRKYPPAKKPSFVLLATNLLSENVGMKTTLPLPSEALELEAFDIYKTKGTEGLKPKSPIVSRSKAAGTRALSRQKDALVTKAQAEGLVKPSAIATTLHDREIDPAVGATLKPASFPTNPSSDSIPTASLDNRSISNGNSSASCIEPAATGDIAPVTTGMAGVQGGGELPSSPTTPPVTPQRSIQIAPGETKSLSQLSPLNQEHSLPEELMLNYERGVGGAERAPAVFTASLDNRGKELSGHETASFPLPTAPPNLPELGGADFMAPVDVDIFHRDLNAG